MAKSIVQHRHCVECRKVCPPEKDTCSDDCETQWNKRLRKKRLYYYMLWALMAVFAAILMVQLGVGN